MLMICVVFFLCSVCLSGGVVHQSLSFECQMGLEPSAGYYSLSVQFHNYSLPKAADCSVYCLTSDLCHAYYVFANRSTTAAFTTTYTYNCWIIPSDNLLEVRGNLLQVSKTISGSICTKQTSSPITNSVSSVPSTLSTATLQFTDTNFSSAPDIRTESISAENDLANETTTNIPATTSTSSTTRESTPTTAVRSTTEITKTTQISSRTPASTTSNTPSSSSTLSTPSSSYPSTAATTETTKTIETTTQSTETTPKSTTTKTTETTAETSPKSTETKTTETITETTPKSTTTKTTTKTTPSTTTTKTTKSLIGTTIGSQPGPQSNTISSLSPNSNFNNFTSNTNNVLLPSSTSTGPNKPNSASATATTVASSTDFDVADFKKMENETTWDDAFTQCAIQNFELVVVDTIQKMNFIANQVTTLYDTNCYWIDAQLLNDDSGWKTRAGIALNSSLINTYLGSDPRDYPAVLCTEVVNTLNSPSTINWSVKEQTDTNGYICEKM